MKKIISIFTVLMIATPAMADLYNVAATTYVQGAFDAVDAKLNVASAGNYISAGTDVKSNLGALDTQVKANADAIAGKATAATTLAGYGITDAYTKTEVDTAVGAKQDASKSTVASNGNYIVAGDGVATNLGNLDTQVKANADAIAGKATAATTLAGYGITDAYTKTEVDTAVGAKQNKLQNNAGTPADINASVLTTVRAASSASDTNLVTEKAVASAVETATTGMVTTSGTQTLTNKTIDADNNTISNLEADNFKTGVVRTSTDTIRATASATDTSLVTEKAVRNAIDTAATVTVTGSTQYGAVTDVSNANGGIQVTKGDAKLQIKSSGTVTGSATMWIE